MSMAGAICYVSESVQTMKATHLPAPLDYPTFTRYVEDNDRRLLVVAEQQRRAQLLAMFESGFPFESAPSSVSMAFSPRPIETTDLLDDLRCLIKSIEALEQENKRLRGRCAYFATINDLLLKQHKLTVSVCKAAPSRVLIDSPSSSNFLATGMPALPPPAPVSAPMSAPNNHSNTATSLTVCSPQPSVHTVGLSNVRGESHSSSRFTSFGAKMTKAATKLLSKPRKLGGSIRTSPSGRSSGPPSLRVSHSTDPGFGCLEGSSSNSSISEQTTLHPIQNGRSMSPQPMRLLREDWVDDRPRSGSMNYKTLSKNADQNGSQTRYSGNDLLRLDSPPGSTMETVGSCSPMVMSTDSLLNSQYNENNSLVSGGSSRKQQVSLEHPIESPIPHSPRIRAWTWDASVRTAASKPWHKLKQMLRRASVPTGAGGAIGGMLNDTVSPPSTRLSKPVLYDKKGSRGTMGSRDTMTSSMQWLHHYHKKINRPSSVAVQDEATQTMVKNVHMLSFKNSNDVSKEQQRQRKCIASVLANLKTDEDNEERFAEYDFAPLKLDGAVKELVSTLMDHLKASRCEIRRLKKAFAIDRLQILDWANAHYSRLREGHHTHARLGHRDQRYNDSAGLLYGSLGNNPTNGQKLEACRKHRRVTRRWFTISSADQVASSNFDTSSRLAASVCALLSSLEPLKGLAEEPSGHGNQVTSLDTLYQNVRSAFTTSTTTLSDTQLQLPVVAQEVPQPVKDQPLIGTVNNESSVPWTERPPDSNFSERGTLVITPTNSRNSGLQTPTKRRSLSNDSSSSSEFHQQLNQVRSDPIASSMSTENYVSVPTTMFSPTPVKETKKPRTSSGHVLMSADELVETVVRSRSASVTSAASSKHASMSLGTASPMTPGSNLSLAAKRRSLIEPESIAVADNGRPKSLAVLAIAMDFVSAARPRSSTIDSPRASRVSTKLSKERDAVAIGSRDSIDDDDAHIIAASSPVLDAFGSPTPPLMSPPSPLSIRTCDSSVLHLPTVQRITPKITVSPDDRHSPQGVSRGRIKSLVELPSASPIGKIFATRNPPHWAMYGTSTTRSLPSNSPSPLLAPGSPPVSGNSSSTNSKNTVVAHLSPPPILIGERQSQSTPTSTTSEYSSSSPDQLILSSKSEGRPPTGVTSDENNYRKQKNLPSSLPTESLGKRHSGHFSWFSRLLGRSPGPLKRFSSCTVGPSTIEGKLSPQPETSFSPPVDKKLRKFPNLKKPKWHGKK